MRLFCLLPSQFYSLYIKNAKHFKPLKEISTVTNEIILELAKLKYENPSVTFAIFYQWVRDLHGDWWPQHDSPTSQAETRSVSRLKAQFEKLKKLRSYDKEEKVQAFLLEEFTLPTLGFHGGKLVRFKFSCNRRQLSVDQLKQNLLLLIGVGQESPSQNHQLSHIRQHPQLLVGKNIKHCFQVGDELVWYKETVLSMNPQMMEFEVEYEEEEDTYLFTLIDDITSGDLELL